MRPAGRRALLALLASAPAGALAQGRAVRDSAGRTAVLPDRVGAVFPAGPPAAVLLATFAPDLMAGWPGRPPGPEVAAFLGAAAGRPGIGRLTGRDDAAGMEAVLARRPDLVLDYGSTAPSYVALADRVRERTGVPTLLLDGALDGVPGIYRLLGEALGREADAAARATAATRILDGTWEAATTLAARGRPRVLHLRGAEGTEAVATGSSTTEILRLLGAENAAPDAGATVPASADTARSWDPDLILASHPDFPARASSDPAWRAVRAVREGRVAVVPSLPFGWLDTPPSVNRLLGLLWLPVLLGARPREGFASEVAGFHALFYGRRPDDPALEALLRPAFPA